jgi:hypothetical protein
MNEKIIELNDVTNNLAEVIKDIREKMIGRGISPVDAPLVQSKLLEVEQKLRQIGSKANNLVPNATPVTTLQQDKR